jgi:hypothetical protein
VCNTRSIALLAPRLSAEAKQTPCWKSWVAHVRTVEASLRAEFSLASATELDNLTKTHHKLFLKVDCPRRACDSLTPC